MESEPAHGWRPGSPEEPPHSKMRSTQEHRLGLVCTWTKLDIISIQSHGVCTAINASMHVREMLL